MKKKKQTRKGKVEVARMHGFYCVVRDEKITQGLCVKLKKKNAEACHAKECKTVKG